jgi:hypothetical protein
MNIKVKMCLLVVVLNWGVLSFSLCAEVSPPN